MSIFKPLRELYIKTTGITDGFHDDHKKLITLYKWWSSIYDFSVRIDPAYARQLKNMINLAVAEFDNVLDIGCGTGLGTVHAAGIARHVTGVDISPAMIDKLQQKINRLKLKNITLVQGNYPDTIHDVYDTIISSFAIVHFAPETRSRIYGHIYRQLKADGKLGLFSAQGEVAPAFEKKAEIQTNLKKHGFRDITIIDAADIYRIVTARKRSYPHESI